MASGCTSSLLALAAMGATACHADVDCCVPNCEHAEKGTKSQTLPSANCFVDSEPTCAFDCDVDGAPDNDFPQPESTAPSAVPALSRAPTESLHADAELIRSVSLATTLKRLQAAFKCPFSVELNQGLGITIGFNWKLARLPRTTSHSTLPLSSFAHKNLPLMP